MKYLTTKYDIAHLHIRFFDDKILSAEEILHVFDICDAGWMHDGDPKRPHAELTSGLCSNGFFDCLRVLCYPKLCEVLAVQLANRLPRGQMPEKVDWVVSSSYAAITFGHEVAKILCAQFGFTEKDQNDPKKQVWRRMAIPKDSTVLQVEELITTSGTFKEVRQAIQEGNAEPVNFLPVVGDLVHRPPKLPADYGDLKVIALIEREVWAVDPSECDLCKAGSVRYRPKTHWKELTGKV